MYLRKLMVRKLSNLYPAAWRKEYGEEIRSMLLAQPLTASVVGDVVLNAMRQNLRRPDPWKIGAVLLICWRSFWIVLPSVFWFSPAAWALLAQIDRGVFLSVALSTGCWTAIDEGDVWRAAPSGWWSTVAGRVVPMAAVILVIAPAPNHTIPGWVFAAIDHFDHHPLSFRYDLVRVYLPMVLASSCGALLGARCRRSTARRNG